jgi:hypothetical protein
LGPALAQEQELAQVLAAQSTLARLALARLALARLALALASALELARALVPAGWLELVGLSVGCRRRWW